MKNNKMHFIFNQEMTDDLNDIKNHFKNVFKVEPSNREVLDLLLKTYKHSKLDIKKNPRKYQEFIIRL